MRNQHIVAHQLKKNVQWHGKDYSFDRFQLNEFQEPTDIVSETNIVRGIFHNSSEGYVLETTVDGAIIHSKTSPQILCLYSSMIFLELGDQVILNGSKYKVVGLTDISNLKIIGEISLEVIL